MLEKSMRSAVSPEPAGAALIGRDDGAEPNALWITIAIVLFCLGLFVITLTGLPQFMDNEYRLSAYVLDALQNGHWFCPTDANGDVASKPPLLMWMAAAPAWLTGRVSRLSLYWPTAFATAVTGVVIFHAGRRRFGWRAGVLAALAYLVSHVGLSQMSMPRYDGLLALPVSLAALAAFSAWQTGRGWTWFWFFAAIGSLVKGPICVLLAAFGLLASLWEKRCKATESIPLRGSHWAGIGLYLLILGGWFALAYAEMGPPLIKKMLGRELVGHAIHGREGAPPLSGFYEPTKFFLGIYAPWSVLTAAALWQVAKRPARDPATRRFERFLFCWFVGALVLFSVAAHQRGRLIYPLIPAAALLVGRQLSLWTSAVRAGPLLGTISGVALLFLAGAHFYTHVLIGRSRRVQETLAMRDLAMRLQPRGGKALPLTYVRSPMSLQVWLNTHEPEVPASRAAELLTNSAPVFVVLRDDAAFRAALPPTAPIFEVYHWPAQGVCSVRIVSNRPRLELP